MGADRVGGKDGKSSDLFRVGVVFVLGSWFSRALDVWIWKRIGWDGMGCGACIAYERAYNAV